MPDIKAEKIEKYLETVFKKKVKLLSMRELGKEPEAKELKAYGYGVPILLEIEMDGEKKSVVIESMAGGQFGHEHFSDRAQVMLWDYDTFNRLPKHAKAIDAGAFIKDGGLISVGNADEFFLLMDFIEGEGYFKDLERIKASGELTDLDIERAKALSDYLAEFHKTKKDEPSLYIRKIRDIIGHGECIMGITDSYPERFEFINKKLFERMFILFWENYLEKTKDMEILNVVQPFYAFRGLVIASPVWYPKLEIDVRKKIFRFIEKALALKKFDFRKV